MSKAPMTRAFLLCFGRRIGAVGVAAALAMIFAPATTSQAEIEPRYYREWQDKAPETLTIRIESVRPAVSTERRGEGLLIKTSVEAEATVMGVERSASGLKPGDAIRIRYVTMRAEPQIVGPRPLPVLKRGQTVPAFLLGVSKGVYAPAARGASFEPLIKLD